MPRYRTPGKRTLARTLSAVRRTASVPTMSVLPPVVGMIRWTLPVPMCPRQLPPVCCSTNPSVPGPVTCWPLIVPKHSIVPVCPWVVSFPAPDFGVKPGLIVAGKVLVQTPDGGAAAARPSAAPAAAAAAMNAPDASVAMIRVLRWVAGVLTSKLRSVDSGVRRLYSPAHRSALPGTPNLR